MQKIFSEELPKALSNEEVTNLFYKMNTGSKEAREKIIIYNFRLVLSRIYSRFQKNNCDIDELFSIGVLGLIKAVDTFEIEKGYKFSSYASKYIDTEIFKFLRQIKKHQNLYSMDFEYYDENNNICNLEDLLLDDLNIEKDYEYKELTSIIKILIEELSEKQKEILKLYFGFYNNKRYTQDQIAKILNLSRPSITRYIKNALEFLKEKIEKTNILELRKKINFSQEEISKIDYDKIRKISENTRKKENKTIYEVFNNYSKNEVDNVLFKLSDEEKKLIRLKFGDNLNSRSYSKLPKKYNMRFYVKLMYKIGNLLNEKKIFTKRK